MGRLWHHLVLPLLALNVHVDDYGVRIHGGPSRLQRVHGGYVQGVYSRRGVQQGGVYSRVVPHPSSAWLILAHPFLTGLRF